ncbi:MBOAT, membrane-bound O-acyltransferase family-domain-containing protein [Aspergillus foveolatus]|uniref:MBOAT, membrane-bound O-acyltransferase family-domain-containing protein n=1 Tax=Aspergillus foveolatus TaxID=210207 RepID=UPI003CCD8D83
MQWLINFIRWLYSLETLDTRFASSTTSCQSFANDFSATFASKPDIRSPLPGTKPSKWWKSEYCIYYLVFVIVVPTMVKQVYDISKPGSPDWDSFSKTLSPGWITGRRIDNSDAQYATFQDNLTYLISLLMHPFPWMAAKVFLIFHTNFKTATRLPRNYVPAATWVFNVGILFANEFCRGYFSALLLSERDQVSYGANLRDFSPKSYFAYTTSLYGLRFLIALLCMELILHYSYALAIIKSSPSWTRYTPYQLAMLGYFNLHAVWLKLLIPWRFFQNMVRCMSDNYSTLTFWRGWHLSINRWIVRYIYVPLGGNGGGKVKSMVNIMAVFTCIAFWHDFNLRLLAWGWLPHCKWKDCPEVFRIFCGIGAVGSILMMMVASLVGFVMGVDDVKEMVKGSFVGWSNVGFVTAAMKCLSVMSAQIMFEHREGEKRKRINLKF